VLDALFVGAIIDGGGGFFKCLKLKQCEDSKAKDIEKVNLKEVNYKIIKPLIWW